MVDIVDFNHERWVLFEECKEMSVNGASQLEVGKAVVIVDDNAAVRRTVGHALLENGFRFYGEAENGAEGIEVVKQLKPDLAIIDLSMPVMNGLEAALILRKLFPQMPIILFSLYGDGAVKAEAARAGIDAVISKTEDMPVLIGKAHELLHF
jgi:two-component system, chemotaxis family, chemotaxis protein CheY